MSYQQIYSLNGGEVSRRLYSRADLARYYASCASLENFLTLPYGGIARRPGLAHISDMGADKIRLLPFRFSTSTTFILAFGNQTMRFYSNGVEVEDPGSPGNPLEVATPWSSSELASLRWEQVQDEVILVHPDYKPYRLFRVADDNWTLGVWSLTSQPFMDANTDESHTVTPSNTTGSITLSASTATWNANHVGAHWRVGHVRASNAVAVDITTTGSSSALLVSGLYTVRALGVWNATIALEGSNDNSNWETIKSWVGENDLTFEYRGTIEAPLYLRATVVSYTASTDTPRMVIEADESLVWGSVEITGFSSATSVTATVVETLQDTTATTYWQEGSWSADNGYPRQVILHDGRMTLAGTSAQPLTIWQSATDDFPNFRQVPGAADFAIQRTLYSPTADQIQWLASRNGALIVGTAGDEWIIRNAADIDNASAQKATAYGSADIGVVELNDSLLFVQRLGTKVRDFIGLDVNDDLARDPYSAAELTLVAEHITREGIEEMAVSQQPDSVLWCVVNGDLVGLTYERDQEIMGWHRHTTDGTIVSVATIPGTYGDEVWCGVLRDGTYRVERFDPATLQNAIDGDQDDCLFVDAGKLVDLGTPGTTVTGLDHLEGLTVSVLVDGGTHPDKTVSSGSITLDRSGTKVAVGLGFTSEVKTLPLVAQTELGSTRYQKSRIDTVIVDVFQSFGIEYAAETGGSYKALQTRLGTDDPNTAPAVRSGPEQKSVNGAYTRTPQIKLRQTTPLPASILALAVSWNMTQDN